MHVMRARSVFKLCVHACMLCVQVGIHAVWVCIYVHVYGCLHVYIKGFGLGFRLSVHACVQQRTSTPEHMHQCMHVCMRVYVHENVNV